MTGFAQLFAVVPRSHRGELFARENIGKLQRLRSASNFQKLVKGVEFLLRKREDLLNSDFVVGCQPTHDPCFYFGVFRWIHAYSASEYSKYNSPFLSFGLEPSTKFFCRMLHS